MKPSFLCLASLFYLLSTPCLGEVEVGEKAADKYFKKRDKSKKPKRSQTPLGTRLLFLHLGSYVSDSAYNWGDDKKNTGVGKVSTGVTYRIGEWRNSTDLLFRVDFNSYKLVTGEATKMSLLPIVTFPDAASGFPLYFGAGIGVGVFFKQLDSESAITIDYQLVAGGRFFNVIDSIGFFIETGLKNHINVLSDGQFNGVFLTGGALFTF